MTGMFDPVFNDYSSATGLSMRQKQTRPYAAKSGTTISDQYLIGYTPSLTAGIWTGYDVGKQLTDLTDKGGVEKNMDRLHGDSQSRYSTRTFHPAERS